jgi:hypothetical protein
MEAMGGEELVGVASANDRIEGEMIQGLLESRGISSVLRPVGIDGPSLGYGLLNPGGGARRVMVPAGDLEAAQTLLAETWPEDEPEQAAVDGDSLAEESGLRGPRNYGLIGAYARIWAVSIAAVGVAFGVFMLLRVL